MLQWAVSYNDFVVYMHGFTKEMFKNDVNYNNVIGV